MTKILDKTVDGLNSIRFFLFCLVVALFIVPLAVAFAIKCIHNGGL